MDQLIEGGAVSSQKFSVDPKPLDPNVPAGFLKNVVFKKFMYNMQDSYDAQLSKLGHSVLKVEPPASIACEKMRETALQSSGCILRISGFIFFFSNRFACFLFAQMKRDIQLVGCPFKDFRNNYRKSKDSGGEKERLFVCPEV